MHVGLVRNYSDRQELTMGRVEALLGLGQAGVMNDHVPRWKPGIALHTIGTTRWQGGGGGVLEIFADAFGCHENEVLLAFSGWRPTDARHAAMYRVVAHPPRLSYMQESKTLEYNAEACNLTLLQKVKHIVFWYGFNIYWIYQEWNYRMYGGETVSCSGFLFARSCSLFWKITSQSSNTALGIWVSDLLTWTVSLCSCHIHQEPMVGLPRGGCKCLITSLCHLLKLCFRAFIYFSFKFRASYLFLWDSLCR